ncbi:hypothetical protein BDV24DRAFT_131547 [Aspergillus arachidicola]|uniref:Uncharacterized protein n=1 Tax=Aspergillus arachidicola TaxID=656916 RepID=A0A5N6YE45_9EURO|nr:hypothetical protein BDV24DRAFT_131547 [Aspergillus arachidicola]
MRLSARLTSFLPSKAFHLGIVKEMPQGCSDADVRMSRLPNPWPIDYLFSPRSQSNKKYRVAPTSAASRKGTTTLFHQPYHGYVLSGGSPPAKHSWPSMGCKTILPLESPNQKAR